MRGPGRTPSKRHLALTATRLDLNAIPSLQAASSVPTAEQTKQALEKGKSLQLSHELVGDLVMALDDVDFGASQDGAVMYQQSSKHEAGR